MLTDEQNATWNDRTDAQRLADIAMSAKPKAIIIDHVGNYITHRLPDVERTYTLERQARKSRKAATDEIPLRYCVNEKCYAAYECTLSKCPECGTPRPPPGGRSTPQEVEGNCFELDPAVLAEMRKEQSKVDGPARVPPGASDIVKHSIRKAHFERQEIQAVLRQQMRLWTSWQHALGYDEAEVMRRFYYTFGRDTLSAMTLGGSEAQDLLDRIGAKLDAAAIVEKTA
jgi:hypothetical protein